jgi:uncharacterized protein YjeT (DUF2065 family)
MWDELLSAMALVLVFEGLLPFLTPNGYRKAMLSMIAMNDRQLRTAGLVSMVGGVLLLYLFRN